jgi:hypothetical protein
MCIGIRVDAQTYQLLPVRQSNPACPLSRRGDGRLAVVERGKAYLGIGIDEGLLVDASNTLQVADIERILGAAVTWMLALEFAVRLLLGLGLFQRDDLRLASVSTRPSWALLASSALSRLFIVSRS